MVRRAPARSLAKSTAVSWRRLSNAWSFKKLDDVKRSKDQCKYTLPCLLLGKHPCYQRGKGKKFPTFDVHRFTWKRLNNDQDPEEFFTHHQDYPTANCTLYTVDLFFCDILFPFLPLFCLGIFRDDHSIFGCIGWSWADTRNVSGAWKFTVLSLVPPMADSQTFWLFKNLASVYVAIKDGKRLCTRMNFTLFRSQIIKHPCLIGWIYALPLSSQHLRHSSFGLRQTLPTVSNTQQPKTYHQQQWDFGHVNLRIWRASVSSLGFRSLFQTHRHLHGIVMPCVSLRN